MRLSRLARLGGLSLVAALAAVSEGCGGGGPGGGDDGRPPDFRDGFEDGLVEWGTGADVPLDPNRPGELVEWSIEPSVERSSEGSASARFALDGRQDDGTIWVVRPFDVLPGTAYEVRLAFDLWSETESFNLLAVVAAYAGPDAPAVEADFDLSQPANQVAGWRRYEYSSPVTTDATGRVWVALGISATFETELEYFVDDVSVWLDES